MHLPDEELVSLFIPMAAGQGIEKGFERIENQGLSNKKSQAFGCSEDTRENIVSFIFILIIHTSDSCLEDSYQGEPAR